MQYSTITALSALLATMASAMPAALGQRDTATNDKFKIKILQPSPSKLPAAHTVFNGTYIEMYHTGAGFNDVTLGTNTTLTPTAFINGTNLQLTPYYANEPNSLAVYAFDFGYVDYQAFVPVEANAGYGSGAGAYYIDETGIHYNSQGTASDPTANSDNNEFAGWLACNWWHYSTAQLFATQAGNGGLFPDNCAVVQLIPEYQ